MPVTFSVASHAAKEWKAPKVESDENLLERSCREESRSSSGIIQSSFTSNMLRDNHISGSANGFVYTAYNAYSRHHHLTIRPEDVWFAILSQTSFYINAHAEELRHLFVAHEGQKELKVVDAGTLHSANFGRLAVEMTNEIQKNVLDPELRAWVMPAFSTTTDTDLVVASVLMMGAVQEYFTFTMQLTCGIPTVTLLGEREDWAEMLERVPKLERLGHEPAQFAKLLKPVLRNFIASLDHPDSENTRNFWGKIAHRTGGSGPYYMSGWITAFCFWAKDGRSLYGSGPTPPVTLKAFEGARAGCELDGTLYHRVNTKHIPPGFASVPVKVDDNGEIYNTRMLAGSVGIKATSSGSVFNGNVNHDGSEQAETQGLYSIQPLSGWWIYEESSSGGGGCEDDAQIKDHFRGESSISASKQATSSIASATSRTRIECLRHRLQGVAAWRMSGI